LQGTGAYYSGLPHSLFVFTYTGTATEFIPAKWRDKTQKNTVKIFRFDFTSSRLRLTARRGRVITVRRQTIDHNAKCAVKNDKQWSSGFKGHMWESPEGRL